METTIGAEFAPTRSFLYYHKLMLGDRLVVGHQTLDLITQVRILVPQPTPRG